MRSTKTRRGWIARVAAVAAATLVAGTLSALAASPAVAGGNFAVGEGPQAVVRDPGCIANQLVANDDQSTGAVSLPSSFDLFGQTFGSVFINNNGNVTFDGPLGTFTPSAISSLGRFIIAPFWADVDTRSTFSGLVNYGAIFFAGRPALCVVWDKVGYFSSGGDKLNDFQLLLVDRSDTGAGNFDIYFNYDQVQWETGSASGGSGGLGGSSVRVGYTNGITGAGGVSFEQPGSAVNGALIDGGPNALITHNVNSIQLGRYLFPVRNGTTPTGGTVAGQITGPGSVPVLGALVQVCGSDAVCRVTSTGADGRYSIPGFPNGSVNVTVNPPGGGLFTGHANGALAGTETLTLDVALTGPPPLPNGTTIQSLRVNPDGTPVLYYHSTAPFTTLGCPGGTALGTVTFQSGATPVLFSVTESPTGSGNYSGTIPELYPNTGAAIVRFSFSCPGGSTPVTEFGIYIDPSGTVIDQNGHGIAGATVTLLRSDSSAGPFVAVPNGSAVMSPGNRNNPDTTLAGGVYGWDVLAGYYKVTASAPDCTTVTTDVLTIPPAVTDLAISLACTNTPPPTFALSGHVQDQNSAGIPGATVTLLDDEGEPVSGYGTNPDTAIAGGAFGWNVPAGTYTVRASAPNCGENESDEVTVPPAVTDVVITLTCLHRITGYGPANVWLGVKNSDDVGTRFDLKAEILKNNLVLGSGTSTGLSGGTSGFNNAIQRAVSITPLGPASVTAGNVLSLRLSVRISCTVAGHASGTARVWYNDAQANSRVPIAVDGASTTYYLRTPSALGSIGAGPKATIDTLVKNTQACTGAGRSYTTMGTFSFTYNPA